MITFHCPGCRQKYEVANDQAGLRAKCRGCGASVTVPAKSEEPSHPAAQAVERGGPVKQDAEPVLEEVDEPELRYEAKMLEQLQLINKRLAKGSPGLTGVAFGVGVFFLAVSHAALTSAWISPSKSAAHEGVAICVAGVVIGACLVADALHRMLGGRR